MDKQPKKVKKKLDKLKNKYRLVILNDESFEEKFSFRLSRLTLFAFVGLTFFLFTIMVTLVIAFTPLRTFIPGYSDVTLRKKGIENALKMDSLELALQRKTRYIENIKNIIQGNPVAADDQKGTDDSPKPQKNIVYQPSKADSLLRKNIETEEKYNLFSSESSVNGINQLAFFPPVKGTITSSFSAEEGHFGVDIVAPKNEPIKATLGGTVIFAEWTAETGYVIQLQHADNLVSIYKHNEELHKKTGDIVKVGEVIATIGNSGELSTGPHLHFELWQNETAINPEEYILF